MERTLFRRVDTAGRRQRAVRRGHWKLLVDGDELHPLLFDLSTDPGERNEMAPRRPDLVRDLRQQIRAWEQDVDAEAKRRQAP